MHSFPCGARGTDGHRRRTTTTPYICTRIVTYTLVYVMHWCAVNTARWRGWQAAGDVHIGLLHGPGA